MRPAPVTVAADADPREAFDALDAATRPLAVAVDADGRLVGVLTRDGALRATLYAPGRRRRRAACGSPPRSASTATWPTRRPSSSTPGVDCLVVDTAHGHQDRMLEALGAVRALRPDGAGRRRQRRLRRGHPRADRGGRRHRQGRRRAGRDVHDPDDDRRRPARSSPPCSSAPRPPRDLGKHVWADGGVRHPRDVALALAAGASSVMIGSWFAGHPRVARRPARGLRRAAPTRCPSAWRRRARSPTGPPAESAYDRARKGLYEEGISSSRMYLDPARPGVEDLIDEICSGVRSACTYAGAATLAELHERAVVGVQSAAGLPRGPAARDLLVDLSVSRASCGAAGRARSR